jgi:hypothetical protein
LRSRSSGSISERRAARVADQLCRGQRARVIARDDLGDARPREPLRDLARLGEAALGERRVGVLEHALRVARGLPVTHQHDRHRQRFSSSAW